MNPRIEATAFRIWQYAAPREWNVTVREIADAIDIPMVMVRNLCTKRGWSNRIRPMKPAQHDVPLYAQSDAAIEEIASNRLFRGTDDDFANRA